ncbi:MAG: YlbF family regulator [Bacillales bacterium]|jgi:cell fate (sporulation/competence/biofilm development) regulator YlbF (YheA/YmcA/DUF963 family)|nr:YlbF family regulator [Bacillales bacterium]
MNLQIIELAYKLKNELSQNKRLLDVKEKEQIMLNDPLYKNLIIQYQTIKEEIERLTTWGLDTSKVKERLRKQRKRLYEIETVKEYNSAYTLLKDFLNDIANTIFNDLNLLLDINNPFI